MRARMCAVISSWRCPLVPQSRRVFRIRCGTPPWGGQIASRVAFRKRDTRPRWGSMRNANEPRRGCVTPRGKFSRQACPQSPPPPPATLTFGGDLGWSRKQSSKIISDRRWPDGRTDTALPPISQHAAAFASTMICNSKSRDRNRDSDFLWRKEGALPLTRVYTHTHTERERERDAYTYTQTDNESFN